METTRTSELGRVLASAETPTTVEDRSTAECGLCDCSLGNEDGVVEVTLSSDAENRPDAWLCPSCYEHVVGTMGISPLRVFKSGTQRRVVLPVSPPADPGR